MPKKLWPSSRPRGTLSGNGYHKEQLVRGQLWLFLGKKLEQWYRSKITRASPFSYFQGQFVSGNNAVTSALCKAPAGQFSSCKLGAALRFCRLSLEGENNSGANRWGLTQNLVSLTNPSSQDRIDSGCPGSIFALATKWAVQGDWAVVQSHCRAPLELCSGIVSTRAA